MDVVLDGCCFICVKSCFPFPMSDVGRGILNVHAFIVYSHQYLELEQAQHLYGMLFLVMTEVHLKFIVIEIIIMQISFIHQAKFLTVIFEINYFKVRRMFRPMIMSFILKLVKLLVMFSPIRLNMLSLYTSYNYLNYSKTNEWYL